MGLPKWSTKSPVVSGAPGRAVLAGLVRLPPARIAHVDGGTGEGHSRVARLLDTVVQHGGQVLIAGDVEGERLANLAQGGVARGLRPTVGVVVGPEDFAVAPVGCGHRDEDGLRNDGLHLRPAPVGRPVAEEAHLGLTQELEAGAIRCPGVEVRVEDVIAPAAGRRHLSLRPRLELAVGDDREADPAVGQRPVIDANPLGDRFRVVGVGVVLGLRAIDDVDPGRGHLVAAGFLSGLLRPARLAPDVTLVDVVVVGDGNAGPVAR